MRSVAGLWVGLSLLALGALVTLGGCAQDEKPATAIAVAVKADAKLEGLSTVQVRLYGAEAPLDLAKPLFEANPQPVSELGKSLVLLPVGHDELVIGVQGLDAKGTVLVESHVRTRFVDGRTIAVPVYLAQSCASAQCNAAAGETCIGDNVQGGCGCRPIPVVSGLRVADSGNVTGSYQPKECEAVCRVEPELPGSTCNLATQCGCHDGKSCILASTTGAVTASCGTSPGRLLEGQPCTNQDQCIAGLACTGTPGTCKRFCETDADCGGVPKSCNGVVLRDGGPTVFHTCVPRCSADDQCATGCCTDASVCGAPDECRAPVCKADSRDTACRACGKISCCDELAACDGSPSCQSLLACYGACKSDSACATRCEQANPVGLSIAKSLSSCAAADCSSACRG